MNAEPRQTEASNRSSTRPVRFPAFESPFLHAPEGARTVFLVTFAAACGPLLAGMVLFGWRAAVITVISIASCAVIERFYFRAIRSPALLGRSHAYLTGLLLALTLPPHVPWYIPVVAAAFAVIVGKGIFGGVGHFLWQPALVGRLAVAVLFAQTLAGPAEHRTGTGAILAQNRLLVGDIRDTHYVEDFRRWRGRRAPQGTDAFLVRTPTSILRGLTRTPEPAFSGLASTADVPRARPGVIMKLPAINDLLYGARPGGIGETCAVVIIVAGLYLIYRNYVKLHLPLAFLLAAAAVAAVAPIRLADPGLPNWVWKPLLIEGLAAGSVYVCYQLLSGGMLLGAFFLATEMTSRPVTAGGQVIFGICCGGLAMGLKLYAPTPIPAYMAVLVMNTFTPTIDALWRPRVLGQKHFAWIRPRRK